MPRVESLGWRWPFYHNTQCMHYITAWRQWQRERETYTQHRPFNFSPCYFYHSISLTFFYPPFFFFFRYTFNLKNGEFYQLHSVLGGAGMNWGCVQVSLEQASGLQFPQQANQLATHGPCTCVHACVHAQADASLLRRLYPVLVDCFGVGCMNHKITTRVSLWLLNSL